MPFFLLCGVFLVGVWWVIGGRGFWEGKDIIQTSRCLEGQYEVRIKAGDTCWAIAGGQAEVLERLKGLNEGVDCDKLGVGEVVCLPVAAGGSRE